MGTRLPVATGVLDLEAGVIELHEGDEHRLTDQEQRLLAYMAARPHQDLSRETLLVDVLDYAPGVASRAVDDAVKRLRAKLERVPSRPFHLVGVRGVGYRFVPLADPERGVPTRLVLQGCTVELDRLLVLREGQAPAVLSATEGRLLEVLLAHGGRPVPTLDLLREVWGIRDRSQRRVVDKLVYRLRAKLESDPSRPTCLCTVRGKGLMLALPASGKERSRRVRAGLPVPAPDHPLVGREAAHAHLRELLQVRGRVLTLHGPAGVGKSALARAVLHPLELARVADLTLARDGLAVREALADGLGVELEPGGAGRRLHAAMASPPGRVLLVEHAEGCVRAAAVEIDALLRAAPEARVVVTSRLPLELPSEVVVPVEPLRAPDARALVVERARSSGVALDPDDPRLQAVIDTVDRLPLALELAAARLRLLGLDGVVQRLSRPLDLFQRSGPQGHQSLRSSLARTWELLTADEQALLAATTALGPSFSVEIAEAALSSRVQGDVLEGLQRLMDFALVRREASGHLVHYHGVVELIREERGSVLQGLEAAIHPALLAWYAELDAGRSPFDEPDAARWSRLLPELPGAWSVVERAGADEAEAVAAILAWVLPMVYRLGRADRARTAVARLRQLQALPEPVERAAHARMLRSRYALPTAEQLDLARWVAARAVQRGDVALELAALGCWLQDTADYGHADDVDAVTARVRQGLDVLGHAPVAEALGRAGLGWRAFRRGDLDEAWAELQEALGLARLARQHWLSSELHRNLAGVCRAEGRLDEAEAFLDLTIGGLDPVRDSLWFASARDMLGLVMLEQGRLAEARVIHEALMAAYDETGQRVRVARQAIRLGTIEGMAGSPARAMSWFEQARATFEAEGNEPWTAACRYNLAECARRMGRLDEARRQFRESLDLYRRMGRTVHEGMALGSLARVDLAEERYDNADERLRQAIALLEAGRARRPAAIARSVLATVVVRKDPGLARALAEEAVTAIGESPSLAEVRARQGEVARVAGDAAAAREALELGEALVRRLDLAPTSEAVHLLDALRGALDAG